MDGDDKPTYCPKLSVKREYKEIGNHFGQIYYIPIEVYYMCEKFNISLQYIKNHECLEYSYKENKMENELNYE